MTVSTIPFVTALSLTAGLLAAAGPAGDRLLLGHHHSPRLIDD